MDNLKIERVWQDSNLLELKVSAKSKYIKVTQVCYVQNEDLQTIGKNIQDFSFNFNKKCYVEFGEKSGNRTPAFSLEFLPADKTGNILIEVDMEIDDNDEGRHRSCFYIQSEIGLVERFGKSLIQMTRSKVDEINLNI
ncbi:hypothetical protein [Candidatus Enterococcus murrayae]|uniref:Uncharacterized protein n=1 Tax=Candidatus Enterococcus murrayae TaxID=2815321 RepID=A0ABS3HI87_9ENTE|nr:hypothetical protein [Enterococcus sp. MJM16]MBO0453178.1 hypothetical protein [Enterococcus sp. MJM16]